MDGVGVAPPGPGNAVTGAETPILDSIWSKYPHGMLEASGLHVGLPEGTDGNSEVGHMTMGAGKIILQDLPRIDNAIKLKTFFENPVLLKAFSHAKEYRGNVHFIGLVGTGTVHSSLKHLFALIEMASEQRFDRDKLFVHPILDGRDSAINAGLEIVEQIEAKLIQKKIGNIASLIGRAIAMDRNKNWDKTRMAYEMYIYGKGNVIKNYRKFLEDQYAKGISDEYIEPCLIAFDKYNSPVTIKENDSVIFFNFRPDRAQQLTRAFEDENFPGWDREIINNLYFVGFTDYKSGFPKKIAFPPESITTPLGKVLSDLGLKQLRVAESEKFPHVTYFFNGGNGSVYPNEKWLQVPSPKDVATYDEKPTMSQELVTKVLIEEINKDTYDFLLVNFAAPDMVAHTGNIEATKVAMNSCDACIGKIIEATLKKDGAVVITADHGNAEEMINLQTGEVDTKHSINQVPFIVVSKHLGPLEIPLGTLADIAPTILSLMGLEVPPQMTGRNLLG
ncbi:MAG: 2,3-bisphosphoglycerate-independent phosphoglycerate mutase [Candidatus Dojkabacteria bacterium]